MRSKAVRRTLAILMALVLMMGFMGTVALASQQDGWAWDPVHHGFAFYRNGVRVGRGQVRAGETVYFAANMYQGADFVFNNHGILVTELVSYGGAWHYFDPDTGSRVAYGFVSWWYDGGFKFLDANGTKRTGGAETVNWEYPIGSGYTFSGTYLFGDDGYLIIDFDFDLVGGTSVHSTWGPGGIRWHQVVTQFYNVIEIGTTGWVMTVDYGPVYLRGDGSFYIPAPPPPPPQGFPQSGITLPNRRLTDAERANWIADYWAMGGPFAFELEVVRLVNEIRVDLGLAYLQIDNTLMMSARFYSQIMANLNTNLGHNEGPYRVPGATHGGSREVVRAFGGDLRWNGGNGAAGHRTPQGLVTAWMDSPGHRAYIVSPEHRFIGVGAHTGGRWGVFQYMFLSNQASN